MQPPNESTDRSTKRIRAPSLSQGITPRRSEARAARSFVPVKGAELYIALQRTSYQHPISRRFRKKFRIGPVKVSLGALYDRWLLHLIEKRRRDIIFMKYFSDMEREYNTIKHALPVRADRILDLGCGMGGIDVFLYNHYRTITTIYLLDKNGFSDVYYGFADCGAFYNSLDLTCSFLLENGLSETKIVAVDIERDPFPSDVMFDLVLSLISWGFHYPVATYLDAVHDVLAPGGSMILDLRRNTPGKQQVAEKFGVAPEIILETGKFERVVVRKPGPSAS